MTGGQHEVAVVLVTHDTRDEVLGCLTSLPADVPTVVVDTGSGDGTAAAVRHAHPRVQVLELANAGFGRGANAGVRATTADVVVVANADVRFRADAPARLAAALTADGAGDVGLLGPRLVYPDGRPQASARALPDLSTALGHALLGRWWPRNPWTAAYRRTAVDPDAAADVGWVSGAAFAVRRTAFDAVDGFDPGFRLYVEDVDLAARLADAGWRVRFDPVTTVVHRVGASTGAHRWRTLWWHAASLDRFASRRYLPHRLRGVLRPLLRVALAGWVIATAVAERTVGRRRSTTGE